MFYNKRLNVIFLKEFSIIKMISKTLKKIKILI